MTEKITMKYSLPQINPHSNPTNVQKKSYQATPKQQRFLYSHKELFWCTPVEYRRRGTRRGYINVARVTE